MAVSSFTRGLATMGLVLALAVVLGCSNGDDGTNPPPGGGLELNSGNLGNGGVYAHTFNTAGSFPYHCSIHPTTMKDTIFVNASGVANLAVSIQTSAFVSSGSTVTPGGTVTWTNNDGTPHTVTSD